MAKVSAHGAHEMAKWQVLIHNGEGISRWLFVLRSDGVLLRRLANLTSDDGYRPLSSGYTTVGRFTKTESHKWAEQVEARLTRLYGNVERVK